MPATTSYLSSKWRCSLPVNVFRHTDMNNLWWLVWSAYFKETETSQKQQPAVEIVRRKEKLVVYVCTNTLLMLGS